MTAPAIRLSASKEWVAAEALARQFFLRKARHRHYSVITGGAHRRPPPPLFDNTRTALRALIRDFDAMLEERHSEAELHEFLRANPILLGAAGTIHSKPVFAYPAPHLRTGKLNIQPDFVISYPDQSYDVIEIESPDAGMVRRDATPRRDFVQPSFQVGEFRSYIMDHAERLGIAFPGIRGNSAFKLIIGRDALLGATPEEITAQKAMLRATHNIDRILTYDDLRRQAARMLHNLERLGQG